MIQNSHFRLEFLGADSEMSIREIYWGGLLGTTSVRARRRQRWAHHNVAATEAQLILRAALRLEWLISVSQLKARERVFLSLQDQALEVSAPLGGQS